MSQLLFYLGLKCNWIIQLAAVFSYEKSRPLTTCFKKNNNNNNNAINTDPETKPLSLECNNQWWINICNLFMTEYVLCTYDKL